MHQARELAADVVVACDDPAGAHLRRPGRQVRDDGFESVVRIDIYEVELAILEVGCRFDAPLPQRAGARIRGETIERFFVETLELVAADMIAVAAVRLPGVHARELQARVLFAEHLGGQPTLDADLRALPEFEEEEPPRPAPPSPTQLGQSSLAVPGLAASANWSRC